MMEPVSKYEEKRQLTVSRSLTDSRWSAMTSNRLEKLEKLVRTDGEVLITIRFCTLGNHASYVTG